MSGFNQEKTNPGILAMEMYVPTRFVSQEDMEEADGCKGKYTVGLGQKKLAFVDDREDVNSIFLTAVVSLLEKYGVDPSEVGRVEVGTETLIDKSKSVKTTLMRLFGDNTDMEGVSNVNACYGGTAALFNSLNWMESSEWNGKYSLVVCGDIAVYEAGPARPTGGCAAVAMLLGFNAPIAMESGLRSSHCLDIYDFYKPHHSEYASVDGKLSQWAYLNSVDMCYERYKKRWAGKHGGDAKDVALDHFDLFAFHSPYNKLVQKGFGRMVFMDARAAEGACPESLQQFAAQKLEDTYESRDLEVAVRAVADPKFKAGVLPCCEINQNIGNCYTGSVYSSLLSGICEGEELAGKRMLMFSYGSGSIASMWSFSLRGESGDPRFSLQAIKDKVNMRARLSARTQCDVPTFAAALDMRAEAYGQAPMVPTGGQEHVAPGTFYLTGINDKFHRSYERKPLE